MIGPESCPYAVNAVNAVNHIEISERAQDILHRQGLAGMFKV
jgi:hypothetical protein